MNARFSILKNRYEGLQDVELRALYHAKRTMYEKFVKVLNPLTVGDHVLNAKDIPLWVKIAHIDEFLECPYCMEEYKEKCKAQGIKPEEFNH